MVPPTVYATLFDERRHHSSVRTMNRVPGDPHLRCGAAEPCFHPSTPSPRRLPCSLMKSRIETAQIDGSNRVGALRTKSLGQTGRGTRTLFCPMPHGWPVSPSRFAISRPTLSSGPRTSSIGLAPLPGESWLKLSCSQLRCELSMHAWTLC